MFNFSPNKIVSKTYRFFRTRKNKDFFNTNGKFKGHYIRKRLFTQLSLNDNNGLEGKNRRKRLLLSYVVVVFLLGS